MGEGNHRLIAAREAGISHLPVRVEPSKTTSSTKSEATDVGTRFTQTGARVEADSYSEDQVAEILGYRKGDVEAYAEAYALWLSDPTHPVARLYAEAYGWE